MRPWIRTLCVSFALVTPMARLMVANAFSPTPSYGDGYSAAMRAYLSSRMAESSSYESDEMICSEEGDAEIVD